MAIENFTTFLEIDPNNVLTVSPNQIDIANLKMGSGCSVSKDMGMGYFNDFTHDFEFIVDPSSNSDGYTFVAWGVADNEHPAWGYNYPNIVFAVTSYGGLVAYLVNWHENAQVTAYISGLQKGVHYYVTVTKTGTTVTATVWETPDRSGTPKGSTSCDVQDLAFSHVAVACSGYPFDDTRGNTNATIYNLDIHTELQPPPASPQSSFTVDKDYGNAPLTVNFTNMSVGAIDSFLWDFGDGQTSSEASPTHTFQAGTYTVVQTVTGPGGQDSTQITITSVPPAFAGTVVRELELTANFNTGGIYANFAGDGAGLNEAIAEFRQLGATSWRNSLPLIVDRRTTIASGEVNPFVNQWRGGFMGLEPDTEYEVRVTFADPNGVIGENPIYRTVRTRSDVFSRGNGTDYHVALTGNDGNPGTLDEPFATFQRALDVVQPGDNVYIHAGTYHQIGMQAITSGQPDAYITISNWGDDDVIFDGDNQSTMLILASMSYYRITKEGGGSLTFQNFEERGLHLYNRSNHNVFENITIRDFGGNEYDSWGIDSGILIATGSSYNLIQNCIITTDRIVYQDEHHRACGINMPHINVGWVPGIIDTAPGMGNVVRYNKIFSVNRGMGDAIGGFYNYSINDGVYRDMDIHDNEVWGLEDDAFECEGGDIDVKVWNNKVSDCWTGIGNAATIVGPLYVINNSFIGIFGCWVKLGAAFNANGRSFYFNNSFYTDVVAPSKIPGFAPYGSSGIYHNVYSRNNIISGTNMAIAAGESSIQPGDLSFDYDCLHRIINGGDIRLVTWGDTGFVGSPYFTTVEDFHAATGNEEHGIGGVMVNGPEFVDPANGNLNLQPSSPCIGAGEEIPGVNGFGDPFYTGAPNIGANGDVLSPPVVYKLTISVSGSGSTSPGEGEWSLPMYVPVQLSANPQTGAAFLRWEEDGVEISTSATLQIIMESDRNITAVFTEVAPPVTHNLTIEVEGAGVTEPAPDTYEIEEGETRTISAVPSAGWFFSHWEEGGVEIGTSQQIDIVMDTDHVIAAVFQEIYVPPTEYSVTVSVIGQGTTDPEPNAYTVDIGSAFSASAQPAAGWKFDHWEGSFASTSKQISFVVNSNMSITAVFTESVPSVAPVFAGGAAVIGIIALASRRKI